ncbi:MAG TPA: BatA domain-containing protein, partial [Thermohalobaculum sp.]|nr:BatA domain-containing protein [Thermohalobaculum sp.]
MFTLGAIGFLHPALLMGLVALPILWWLLRAIPPSPKLQLFAGVRLLLGLEDPEREASKTPWWLLLLRVLAVAAVILGFAGPVLNPNARLAPSTDGPVLVLMDQGWASAPDWAARKAAALTVIDEAGQSGRPVLLWQAAAAGAPPPLVSAREARAVMEAARPAPWAPDHAAVLGVLDQIPAPAQTVWLHDGLSHGAETAELAARLAAIGPLRLIGPAVPAHGLTPPRLEEGRMLAEVLHPGGAPEGVDVIAFSEPPGEPSRRIGVARAEFAAGADSATAEFNLPAELLGRITRISLADGATAGGTALAEAGLGQVSAAIVDPRAESAVATLTSASHYLRQALAPWAATRVQTLEEALADPPAVIVLADMGDFLPGERGTLTEWVESGGLLIRFAGPRLAAAVDEGGFSTGGADDKLL